MTPARTTKSMATLLAVLVVSIIVRSPSAMAVEEIKCGDTCEPPPSPPPPSPPPPEEPLCPPPPPPPSPPPPKCSSPPYCWTTPTPPYTLVPPGSLYPIDAVYPDAANRLPPAFWLTPVATVGGLLFGLWYL